MPARISVVVGTMAVVGWVGLALLSGCGPAKSAKANNFVAGTHAHVLPMRSSPAAASAPAGANLNYYGGHVISNIRVVQVLYGAGTYLPGVTGSQLGNFYQQATNSAYWDWLSEYNTTINASNGQPGTQQIIGRGSFAGQYQITPASANDGSPLNDSNIQAELNAQINAGTLPAPDADTIYMINFPKGQAITMGGTNSCRAGGFCAYHGTFQRNGQSVYYGVLPDISAGSGCDTGCGGAPNPIDNQTSIASHEMVEATTDAEVGLATFAGPPLAWYDQSNGEIGDICNGEQGTFVGTDGVTYTAQKEFSNSRGDCIMTKPPAADFSLTVAPTTVNVAPGGSISVTVTTSVTLGAPEPVSLATGNLPVGVTAAFNPATATSGGISLLTFSAASSVAAGSATVTVVGTDGDGHHHSAQVTLTFGATAPPATPIANGGFESGDLAGWTASGVSSVTNSPHSGAYAARLGSTAPSTDSAVSQTFTVPSGDVAIVFWYNVACLDHGFDWASATLKDNTAGTTATVLPNTCTSGLGWQQVSAAVTAGHSYTLTLMNHDDNHAGDATYTEFDDVALTTSLPNPPPPSTGGVVNGDFETGNLNGWTQTVGTSSIASHPHTGTSSALVGSTSPTAGDSTLSQTFTVPSGNSTLLFWYANVCPDTVANDWATITLVDNTLGSTFVVLSPICDPTGTWTQLQAPVTPGHSYTLNLTNHDDNGPSDPTYTYFDDISLQ